MLPSGLLLLCLCSLLSLPSATRALIGGQDAKSLQFPYQVLVHGVKQDVTRLYSSGALIHPEWVLTTAESVAHFSGLTVTLGVVQRDGQNPERQDIPALSVHLHPDWAGWSNWKTMYINDIALVRLSKPAILSDAVQIAYLPKAKSDRGSARAIIGGWGTHREGPPQYGYRNANQLQWMETETMSFLRCFWKRFFLLDVTGPVKGTHICADTKGQGPCYNDGGAPLVLAEQQGGNRTVIVGLFTAAIVNRDFCTDNYPSVYTRVSSYLDWIHQVSGV